MILFLLSLPIILFFVLRKLIPNYHYGWITIWITLVTFAAKVPYKQALIVK